MIVAYWGRGPTPSEYGYVTQDYPNVLDAWIDFAAASTYDYHSQVPETGRSTRHTRRPCLRPAGVPIDR